MSLISMKFLTFVAVAVIGYYLIPKRYQWIWLLAFSYIYYASSGMKYLVFLLYTTVVTYGTARLIYGADQKFADQKEKIKTYKKSIMLLALLLDFGMLAVLKYTNFTISNINTLFHTDIRMVKFLLPLGISFYTFQSVGYILDVYWKRYEPEKNIFKFALFVSFFPQILQGPIGRYSNLAHQFYEEHSFDFMRIERGVQRVLWGFFKKMVIADTAAVFVDVIFDQYQTYNGLAIFGVLAYSAQLYGDFSGGMDVVIGIASMFGIEMDENFKRPYFSISITDFWHSLAPYTWNMDERLSVLSFVSFKRNGQIQENLQRRRSGKRMDEHYQSVWQISWTSCSRYLAWSRLEVHCVRSVQRTNYRIQRSDGKELSRLEKEIKD